jgi:hypothetical protein
MTGWHYSNPQALIVRSGVSAGSKIVPRDPWRVCLKRLGLSGRYCSCQRTDAAKAFGANLSECLARRGMMTMKQRPRKAGSSFSLPVEGWCYSRLESSKRHRGLQALGYVENVSHTNLPAFLARTRQDKARQMLWPNES